VGFRYTVQNMALQYDVAGYVRNLRDGRVELVVEGPEAETNALVADIRQRMSDYIQDVDIKRATPTGQFHCFCIKH
jgi:acylphosphatase